MRKLIISTVCVCMTGCATTDINQYRAVEGHADRKFTSMDNKEFVKTVATILVVGAIAGAVGRANQQNKCDNNRAGFWRDNTNGNVYTCP